MSDYDALGGAAGLRRVLDDFVNRVMNDTIIGFLFERVDREQLIAHEVAFAAAHLGGPKAYAGRPLPAVHRPKRIHRGHFRRRAALLRTTLRAHAAPEDVIARWLATEAALMDQVVSPGDCLG